MSFRTGFLDLNGSGTVEGGDLAEWAVDPIDLDDDETVDLMDAQYITDNQGAPGN